jgi:hypothetical protein
VCVCVHACLHVQDDAAHVHIYNCILSYLFIVTDYCLTCIDEIIYDSLQKLNAANEVTVVSAKETTACTYLRCANQGM